MRPDCFPCMIILKIFRITIIDPLIYPSRNDFMTIGRYNRTIQSDDMTADACERAELRLSFTERFEYFLTPIMMC